MSRNRPIRSVALLLAASASFAAVGATGATAAHAQGADYLAVLVPLVPTSLVPTSQVPASTLPLVNSRGWLNRQTTLGQGQLRFDPPVSERPKLSAGAATTTAVRSLRAKVAGKKREAFFALFSASSPAQRNTDGTTTPLFDRRPVWVVRFPSVVGRRQSGVLQRKNAPPTTSLEVITEIVVIVDDRSGRVVLTTEFLPEG